MNVRDALEADADALAALADSPTDVMRNLVHDRTVRVAENGARADDDRERRSDPTEDSNADADGTDAANILGFVSFDARAETVHVTQIDGTDEACRRLLAEPVRFAEGESMAVEVLVTRGNEAVERAAEDLGFEHRGLGPRFDGERTVRFRLEP